jgi:hypothetical protein
VELYADGQNSPELDAVPLLLLLQPIETMQTPSAKLFRSRRPILIDTSRYFQLLPESLGRSRVTQLLVFHRLQILTPKRPT